MDLMSIDSKSSKRKVRRLEGVSQHSRWKSRRRNIKVIIITQTQSRPVKVQSSRQVSGPGINKGYWQSIIYLSVSDPDYVGSAFNLGLDPDPHSESDSGFRIQMFTKPKFTMTESIFNLLRTRTKKCSNWA